MTVQFRAEIDDYTSQVLGVIKERYGLTDKAAALNKFAKLYGSDFVPLEVKDDVMKELIYTCNEHVKKYGKRKMTIKDLDALTK
jgi:chorismate mutase